MSRYLRLTVILMLAFCFAMLTACDASWDRKVKQSQLTLATPSDVATFNYAMNNSPFSVFPFIYQGLVTENGKTNELEPALAESWKVSDDKLRITFKLRDKLKWSDGKPLTVDDVIFTYKDIYLNKKIPTLFKDFLRIGNQDVFPEIRKLDNRTIEFSLPEPFTPFLRKSASLAILPAHALRDSVLSNDANGNPQFLSTWGSDTAPEKIIVNGAYQIESYTPSERIILKRNPYYFRKDAQGQQMPYIKSIIWQIIPSTDNHLLRFRSGELDSLRVKPDTFALLKREEKRGNFSIYNGGLSQGIRFVTFNLNQASNSQGKPFVNPVKSRWFNNLAFRQAIAYAINRDRIKTNIYQGIGELQHSPIAVQSPYYLSPAQGLKTYSYNPQKAKQLLTKAGFQYDSQQQLLDKDGNQVKFNILVKSEDQTRVATAVQIQQDLKQIGIQANLQTLSFNTVLQKILTKRDWDCYVGAFESAIFEPNLIALFWTSNGSFHMFNKGSKSKKRPIIGWKVNDWEKQIDQLFQEGAKEADENKRKQIYAEFQQIVAEQLPVFFLVNPVSLQAVRNRVENVEYSAVGGLLWNVDEWRLKGEG
ncbi:ABC-type dipeptide transport system, periplasmic component [Rivularia sp. PCC 7116]|uniref:ABC transporter substrate-binding protein n=1 Tax=Rivularia sp. PCC 7116 TaxID=373994 RepID=UPI00029F4AD9|nr:ABC transporter substrate-binding protein [Rivularia sp. PCC 7116]AFY56514.1 ABC-type dipeptide transport system, periplasmic component [Rivularia sp. PCC 7116]